MNRIRSSCVIALLLSLSACKQDTVVDTSLTNVQTTFDLWTGFSNQHIVIEIDALEHFNAILSPSEPFAGPVARFASMLTRTQHQMVVKRDTCMPSTCPFIKDTLDFSLGQSQKYFVGIGISGDSVYIRIQDRPFIYMYSEIF